MALFERDYTGLHGQKNVKSIVGGISVIVTHCGTRSHEKLVVYFTFEGSSISPLLVYIVTRLEGTDAGGGEDAVSSDHLGGTYHPPSALSWKLVEVH